MEEKEAYSVREDGLRSVKDDIEDKGLSVDEVYDRATWRRMSPYIDPT